MLTKLIQPRHLEWLGVVEWEAGLRRRLNLSNKYDNSEGLVLYAREKWCMGKWMFDAWLSGHEASCILEHAIGVKLGINATSKDEAGMYYSPILGLRYSCEAMAMLAVIDALLKREKEVDGG